MTGAVAAADGAIAKALNDPDQAVSKVDFEIAGPTGVSRVLKSEETDDYVIWGPASVEVVDRENDRIKADALRDALPQLLKRSTLSYEHTDQIVGDILTEYEAEEPCDVEIQGETYTRKSFPTGVLDLEGMEPALYVAGRVYGDTQRSRDVREDIDKGEIGSYSISGEAIMTEMAVEDGVPVTDILKMDLSAVTLCRQGMNQKAKFGLVSKSVDPSVVGADGGADPVAAANAVLDKHMGTNDDDDNQNEELIKGFEDALDDRLPDGDLATIEDVEKAVDERFEKTDDDEDESDDNEETPEGPDGAEAVDVESEEEMKSRAFGELKSALPADQWQAIKPVVKDCMDDDKESLDVVEPEEEAEDEPDLEDLDVKSISELDGEDAERVAKSLLEKAGGETPAANGGGGETTPSHVEAGTPSGGVTSIESEADIEKAAESIHEDPVAASMMDEDGNYRI